MHCALVILILTPVYYFNIQSTEQVPKDSVPSLDQRPDPVSPGLIGSHVRLHRCFLLCTEGRNLGVYAI